ncbi:MAG: alpha-2-macroglobulin family protein, partial [Planctomycetota bacterium]
FFLEDVLPGEVRILAAARGRHASDAVEITLPAEAHGVPRRFAASGLVKAGATFSAPLPKRPTLKPGTLKVHVSGDLTAVVREALPYLAKYPYGCTEQTMSRFLPAVVAARSLKALGIELGPPLAEELPKMVKAGLCRLYDFQHEDGGWGWWTHDETNPWMTAYVTGGLAAARDAGFEVDRFVLAGAQEWLDGHCRKGSMRNPEMRAFCCLALARTGQKEVPGLDNLWQDRTQLGAYALALTCLALESAGRRDEAKTCAAALAGKAKKVGDCTLFSDPWKHWSVNGTHVNAVCLRACIRLLRNHPIIPEILSTLLRARSGSRWGSTLDTAQAILTLCEFLGKEKETGAAFRVHLKDRVILSEGKESGSWSVQVRPEDLPAEAATVRLENVGEKSLQIAVEFDYWATDDPFKPEGPIAVERSICRLQPAEDGSLEEGPPLPRGAELTVGDLVRVYVRLELAQGYAERLVVEVPRPSCLEPVIEDMRGSRFLDEGFRAEFRDRRSVFFLHDLDSEGMEITYDARVERPGRYHAPPVGIYAMYSPETYGTSADTILVVQPKGTEPAPPPIDHAELFRTLSEELQGELDEETGPAMMILCTTNYEPFWSWVASREFVALGICPRFLIRGIARRSRASTAEGLGAFLAHPVIFRQMDTGALEADRLKSLGIPGSGPKAAGLLAEVIFSPASKPGVSRHAAGLFRELDPAPTFPHLHRFLESFVVLIREGKGELGLELLACIQALRDMNFNGRVEGLREFTHEGRERHLLRIHEYGTTNLFMDLEDLRRFGSALEMAIQGVPNMAPEDLRAEAAEWLRGAIESLRELRAYLSEHRVQPGIGVFTQTLDTLDRMVLDQSVPWLEDESLVYLAAEELARSGEPEFREKVIASSVGSDPEIVRQLMAGVDVTDWKRESPFIELLIRTLDHPASRATVYARLGNAQTEEAVDFLRKAFSKETGITQVVIFEALVRSGEPALPDLLEAVATGADEFVMNELIRVILQSLRPLDRMPALAVLQGAGLPLRKAIGALQAFQTSEAVDALFRIAVENGEERERAITAAVTAIQSMQENKAKPWKPAGLASFLELGDLVFQADPGGKKDLLDKMDFEEHLCRLAKPSDAPELLKRLRAAEDPTFRFRTAAALCHLADPGQCEPIQAWAPTGAPMTWIRNCLLLALGKDEVAEEIKAAVKGKAPKAWKLGVLRCLFRTTHISAPRLLNALLDAKIKDLGRYPLQALASHPHPEGQRLLVERYVSSPNNPLYKILLNRVPQLDADHVVSFARAVLTADHLADYKKSNVMQIVGVRIGKQGRFSHATALLEAAKTFDEEYGGTKAQDDFVEGCLASLAERECSPEWIPLLLPCLANEDWESQELAMKALVFLPGPRIDDALRKAHSSKLFLTRRRAAELLFIRTGESQTFRNWEGRESPISQTVELHRDRAEFLLRSGRYFEVRALAESEDPLLSETARDVLTAWMLDLVE